jgi:glycosyltransferase involved in cell wall biosynthesis
MMMITVILCTYNRCQSLAKALESIAVSRLPPSVEWEVLVVDNNSNDQTRETIGTFCDQYSGRFRYLFEPRQGKSYALNAGIQASQSDVLAFADDDATVEPDWLWNLTSALRNGECSGAGGRIIPVWEQPLPRWLSTADPHTMWASFVAFDLGPEVGPLTRPPYGANMAFRRDVFDKYGGFRTDLGPRPGSEIRAEDVEFAQRLLDAGEQLRYEPSAVVYHPVPENRLKKGFVRRWWFWFGYTEIAQFGLPPATRWRVSGVPLYLVRRLVRWALRWMVTVNCPSRFSCERNVWYIAGIIFACYKWPHSRQTKAKATNDLSSKRSAPESGITS